MSIHTTPNYGFSYYDQYDIGWHSGINNNFINLDSLLANIEQEVGLPNFIPHSLLNKDSNADGIPELWTVSDDGCTVSKSLATSEIMGFAKKVQLTISNNSGVTKYPEFRITGILPPNLVMTFSAWLKSADLAVQLRINDGTNNFDSTALTEAAVARREISATLDTAVAAVTLSVRITVPTGTSGKLVEAHLPMLNAGNKAAAFCPAVGELVAMLIAGGLYFTGTMQSNFDFNGWQAKNIRLDLRTADPSPHSRGQIWFDDNAGKKVLRFCDGTTDKDLSIAKQIHIWSVAGVLSTGSEQGGAWIAPQALTIEKAYIYCKTTGSAGSTIVDIHRNGATIFINQGNRPVLDYSDADKKVVSGNPDVTSLSEGDIVTLDIDQIATGAADLSVILICR